MHEQETLPLEFKLEIREMRSKLPYTDKEARSLLKYREEFERKIHRVTNKSIEDYLDYISFEKMALFDMKVRKEKMTQKPNTVNIEMKIQKRIKSIYEMAINAYQDDLEIRLSYFKYCRDKYPVGLANRILHNILQLFPEEPTAYVYAAKHYEKTDKQKAVTILESGLRKNQDSPILYRKLIEIEIHKAIQDNGGNPDGDYRQVLFRLTFIIEDMVKYIKDIKFLCSILKYLECARFTKNLQNALAKKLMENYRNEEYLWKALALKEKRGFHYNLDPLCTPRSYEFRIGKCFEKFEEGTKRICPAKKGKLWKIYINFLTDLRVRSVYKDLVTDKLKQVFDKACAHVRLADVYYVECARLYNDPIQSGRVIEKGLKVMPDSILLWKARLEFTAQLDDQEKFNKQFKRAILCLKEKALTIWYMALKYYTLIDKHDVVEHIYTDAIRQPEEVSSVMKPEFIEWLVQYRSVREARRVYNSIANKQPYCKELHVVMARIEYIDSDEEDYFREEQCLINAYEQFGDEGVDVWISLMKFYLRNRINIAKRNPAFNTKGKITDIYHEGVVVLGDDPMLVHQLKTQYDRIMRSIANAEAT